MRVMDLVFPAAVGLAAGYDRDGSLLGRFRACGFGFIELGTVTPLPVPEHNPGVQALARTIRASGLLDTPSAHRGVIGINLGMQPGAHPREAWRDYVAGLKAAWGSADYFALNLTSPSTRLANGELQLGRMLSRVRDAHEALASASRRYAPLLIKLAVAADRPQSLRTAALARQLDYDGLIVLAEDDAGTAVSTLECLTDMFADDLALIAVGGIRTAADARARYAAGASLVQIHRAVTEGGSRWFGFSA
jgi:dihydroorotate dehydrogenase